MRESFASLGQHGGREALVHQARVPWSASWREARCRTRCAGLATRFSEAILDAVS